MSKAELIEKTIASLKQLPEHELKEIHDFAEFLLAKIQDRLLTEDVTQLNAASTSYKFLEEDTDLYTVNDLKVKYGK